MSINTISRIVGSVIATATVVSILLFDRIALADYRIPFEWGIAIGVAIIIVAFIITPYISVIPYRWMSDKISRAAASDLVAAAIGLTIGLIISALLAIPLANLPATWGHLLPFVGAVLFGYLGVTIAVIRKNDIAHLFQGALQRRTRERDEEREK
ncbi:MAG: PIN domain nuclease, partial [Ktedonobacteraceae bacterium]|nr:PIN domain nuclease [Ktedonobacteraceae bacterium]